MTRTLKRMGWVDMRVLMYDIQIFELSYYFFFFFCSVHAEA